MRAVNFDETFRTIAGPNNSERQEKFFIVFFDGFILLVMGYTGKKALEVKLVYIAAFNAMREELEGRKQPTTELLRADTLTPEQQAQLQAIVQAKMGMLPKEVQRKAYKEVWSRFNNHFRIARYAQLSPTKMGEAVEYLVGMEVKVLKTLPSTPTTPPMALQSSSLPTSGILSAELARYAAEFEAIACHIEDLSGLLQRVERLSSPLVSDACRVLVGTDHVRQAHLDATLMEMLDGSRRMADALVPRARLGINVMRDLALAQGR